MWESICSYDNIKSEKQTHTMGEKHVSRLEFDYHCHQLWGSDPEHIS